MARKSTAEVAVNMTPMIDIVFQLIIFFVVTTELEKQVFDERILLAFSPNGPAIEERDPRTIVVDVDEKGRVSITRNRMSLATLENILKGAVSQYGSTTPVQIRGDRRTKHESIRQVMESCGRAGIWRVSFVAQKEVAGAKK
jgi:biopolymer transport protein ExbD